jgi:hypothetical protein
MKKEIHVGELLSGYLDAALDRGERERVESHLQACERCRAELQTLRALQADLRAAPRPEPPPGYWERFAARVESELPEHEPRSPVAWAARVAEWFLPSGRLAWTRAVGAVATITIVTFVAIRGFQHADVGMQPRETLGSSPSAEPPPTRQEPSTSVTSDLDDRTQTSRDLGQSQGTSGGLPVPSTPAPEGFASPPHEARAKRELGKSAAAPRQKPLLARDAGEKERPDAPAEEMSVTATTEAYSAAPAPSPLPPPGAQTNRMAAPQAAAPSPEAAPQALKAGSLAEVERAEPAAPVASVENAGVLRFVQAALAGDTGAAREACEAFQKLGAAAAAEHMRSWLRRVEPAPQGKELRRPSQEYMLSNQSADPAVAQLLDLDALVWQRRADTSFGSVVADLAGRFEAHAAAGAESRGRAVAYLDWLAAQAPDAASRDLWHERAEKLRD